MINLSYTSPYEGEIETLELLKDPKKYGLGYYEDIKGTTWDVEMIRGNADTGVTVINARPVDDSPYYSTAFDSHSFGFHSWKPYFYNVIKKEENVIKEK